LVNGRWSLVVGHFGEVDMRRPYALGLMFLVVVLARPAAQPPLRSVHWVAASAGQAEPPRQRLRRESPPQHQVERTIGYFAGKWRFEYTGGEFPPLSGGSRSGTITFLRIGTSNFVAGQLDGELAGKPYRETQTIGFDPDTFALAVVERRPDNNELVSVGHWRSPLAILFQTAPVQAGGKTYQLKRVISVTSDVAFEVTEDFSVDGGPFKRLGKGHYTKQP
jgi:hypothetical protein